MQLILFFCGACWASFVTTGAWRCLLHHEVQSVFSVCDGCKTKLQGWQLLPIIGYCLQAGKCIHCRQAINPFWTITELISGITWALLPLFLMTEWPLVILAQTVLLIISTEDWFSNSFHTLLLVGLLPLHFTTCGSSWHVSTICACLALSGGYFLKQIGAGDIDFLIIVTLACGFMTTTYAIFFACLLSTTNPALYRHQPCPFIPYLSVGLLAAVINQLC